MKFFTTLAQALYSKGYVARFSGRSFGEVSGYLLCLFLLQTIVLGSLLVVSGVPFVSKINSGAFIDDFYPDNLQIQITNGEVTTNVEQPYIIREPKATGSEVATTSDIIAVIDTTATDTVAAIERYKATVLLTHNAIIAKKSSGEIRIIPLTDVKDFHLDRVTVHSYYQKALPFVYITGVFLIVLIPLTVAFFLTLFEMLGLLLAGCIVLAIASLRKVKLTYGQAYVLSGYLATFPILVGVVTSLLKLKTVLLVNVLLFIAVALLNIRNDSSVLPTPVGEAHDSGAV